MARKKQQSNAAEKKHLVATGELHVESDLTDMFAGRENKYLLVNLIARRSRELNKGEPALVDLPRPYTYTQLAMAEIQQNKLKLKKKSGSKVMVNLIESE